MREHVDVTDLEQHLADLGANISYRKTPEISAPLAPQLRSETPQKRPRPLLWHLPSQRIVQAAAAAVIIAGFLFVASPAARAGVARLLGLQTSATKPVVLGSVDFLTPRVGWVTIGNSNLQEGALYGTRDGGHSWTKLLLFGTGSLGQRFGLLGTWLQFTDARHGFLYTAEGTQPLHKEQVLYRTSDGGRHWIRLPLPQSATEGLLTFTFNGSLNGWMLVNHGGSGPLQNVDLWHTTNGGKIWRMLTSSTTKPPPPLTPSLGLSITGFANQLLFPSPARGWLLQGGPGTADRPLFSTADGGVVWSPLSPPAAALPQEGQYSRVFSSQVGAASLHQNRLLIPVAAAVYAGADESATAEVYVVERYNPAVKAWLPDVKVPAPVQLSRLYPASFISAPIAVDLASSSLWGICDPTADGHH